MKDGTKEDYLLLDKHEKEFVKKTPDRILKYMSGFTSALEGYQLSRLEHSLQSATRALNDKAEDEMIVATLLHDIGDELAFHNHSEFSATILKPYVNEKTHWIVEKHGIFQLYYYASTQQSPHDLVLKPRRLVNLVYYTGCNPGFTTI